MSPSTSLPGSHSTPGLAHAGAPRGAAPTMEASGAGGLVPHGPDPAATPPKSGAAALRSAATPDISTSASPALSRQTGRLSIVSPASGKGQTCLTFAAPFPGPDPYAPTWREARPLGVSVTFDGPSPILAWAILPHSRPHRVSIWRTHSRFELRTKRSFAREARVTLLKPRG